MIKIYNVLEIINGIPAQLQSFPIWEEETSKEVIEEAEYFFEEVIKYHEPDISEEDIKSCLEERYFDNKNGKEVYIIWSD